MALASCQATYGVFRAFPLVLAELVKSLPETAGTLAEQLLGLLTGAVAAS
mgnify:CR=1 FL=1